MNNQEAIWWVNHLFEIRKEEYFNKGMMKDAKEVEEAQRMATEALSAPQTDLISRADAVCEVLVNDGIVNIVDRIAALPSADTEWIPVSERLPEELEEVLVCVTHNGKSKMAVSCRRDYNYWDIWGRDIIGDMAWRPLPEPYKESDSE